MTEERAGLIPIGTEVWSLKYPLGILGNDLGRRVTICRLQSGKLIIHSTAPFTAEDIQLIRGLGDPGWLMDATIFHDSFAKEGCRAFERVPYLAPPGFTSVAEVQTRVLFPPPTEWNDEVDVFPLAGMPKVHEHVLFHRASRTLIVCDMLFNLGATASGWTRFFARYVMQLRNGVGMSFFFRLSIKDRAAFKDSIKPILACDFERIVVGHGAPIVADAERILREELARRDLLPNAMQV
jgi:hypothetical protein